MSRTGVAEEDAIARFAIDNGCKVVRFGMVDFRVNIIGGATPIAVPDLLITTPAGVGKFVEVKAKTEATFYRASDSWQTGIDMSLLNDYCDFANAQPLPVEVWIVQHDRSAIYVGEPGAMRGCIHHEGNSKGKLLAYWELSSLSENIGLYDAVFPLNKDVDSWVVGGTR